MKKNYISKLFLTGLFFLFGISLSFGQTTVFSESGGGSAPTGWTFNNQGGNDIDRGSYWLVDATASENIITTAYDLSSYASAEFRIDVATFGSGTANPALIEISYDNGANYTQSTTTATPSSSSYITGGPIALTGTLTSQVVIRISNNATSGRGVRLRNLELVATGSSSNPTVGFDSAASSETETDSDVVTSGIPVTLTNYDAANVTITPTVNGSSTAEAGDYTIDLTPLVFDANETLNIPLTIKDDADFDDETLIIDFTVTSGTADLGTSQHTVTITDDEVAPSGLQVSSVNTNVVIDFDSTVSGINDGQYSGYGFSSSPSSGQLDSDAWKSTGMSDGDTAFGDTDTSGDYARGTSSGNESSGGFYAFETSSGNFSLGYQPTSSDFTPGTITLRAQNQTGVTVTDVYLYYVLYVLNNENRTNDLNFEYSTDDSSYTPISALDFTSTESEDVSASWEEHRRSTAISSLSIADGGYFYLRWTTDNIGGSGSQDEFAIDDITINFNPVISNWTGSSGTDWGTGGNWDNGIPTSTTTAIIPDVANAPIVSGTTGAEVNNLTINETDGVTISSGGSLQVDGVSSGNLTYNRSLGTTNWYLVGIPVAGETIEDMISNNSFATGNGSNIGLAPYDNSQASASDRWDYQTAASTGSLTSGGGYSVKLASSGTLAFTGTMQTADVGVSITDNSGGSGNAFNLVGNPYPSYLAANTNADGTNNLLSINSGDLTEQTMWLWNQSLGTYETYNQASPSFHIAPGQGFFVSSSGSNTFNFTEAMQSHQGTDTFRTTDPNTRPEIELGITDGTDSRKADIFYIDGTTTSFDNGFDSSMFGGASSAFAIYTHLVSDSQGENLAIQSLPPSDFENMIIPVGVNATSGTEITISSTSINLPAGMKVFLEDKNDSSFTELNATSDFTTTLLEDMNGIGRFYLHTSTEALSTDTVTLDYISIYPTNPQNLKVTGVHSGNLKVAMFNILGSKVLSTSVLANGSNDIPLPSLTSGVYIVQVETQAGSVNKKIIIE